MDFSSIDNAAIVQLSAAGVEGADLPEAEPTELYFDGSCGGEVSVVKNFGQHGMTATGGIQLGQGFDAHKGFKVNADYAVEPLRHESHTDKPACTERRFVTTDVSKTAAASHGSFSAEGSASLGVGGKKTGVNAGSVGGSLSLSGSAGNDHAQKTAYYNIEVKCSTGHKTNSFRFKNDKLNQCKSAPFDFFKKQGMCFVADVEKMSFLLLTVRHTFTDAGARAKFEGEVGVNASKGKLSGSASASFGSSFERNLKATSKDFSAIQFGVKSNSGAAGFKPTATDFKGWENIYQNFMAHRVAAPFKVWTTYYSDLDGTCTQSPEEAECRERAQDKYRSVVKDLDELKELSTNAINDPASYNLVKVQPYFIHPSIFQPWVVVGEPQNTKFSASQLENRRKELENTRKDLKYCFHYKFDSQPCPAFELSECYKKLVAAEEQVETLKKLDKPLTKEACQNEGIVTGTGPGATVNADHQPLQAFGKWKGWWAAEGKLCCPGPGWKAGNEFMQQTIHCQTIPSGHRMHYCKCK